MQTGLISELDAINKILAVTGDSPVATLDDSYIQSKLAQQILKRASRDIQTEGWWFNEEESVTLQKDLNGFITLAPNIISVLAVNDSGTIIQRGNRLYDRSNRTYVFESDVTADIITALEWDELPQEARAHIVNHACIEFNNDFFGAEDVKRTLEQNYQQSMIELKKKDVAARDINLLQSSRVRNIAFKNRR